ncbi:hypothetical protein DTO164E3_4322 [Paecilomyces variotii]|nr:hypothetical protein DTO164E3_4322 [Paecilomyces variotii]KAJ9404556.1 hypothetical protein DTO045G8_7778 [Paecilomyces variotii]
MSGIEVVTIVACVAAIVSAYTDGTELVKRIKEKREAKRRKSAEQKIQDLERSLASGPPAVQTQYDSNFRRFGTRYEQGDQIAREQMKDIIIKLQMALLKNLSGASNGDVEVDFAVLQMVSEDSRLRAIRALYELYQRMEAAAPIRVGPGAMLIPGAMDPQFINPFSSSPTDQFISVAEPQGHPPDRIRTGSFSLSLTRKRRSIFGSLLHSNSRQSNDENHASSSRRFTIPPVSEIDGEGDGNVRRNDPLSPLQVQERRGREQRATARRHTLSSCADLFFTVEEDNPWTEEGSREDEDSSPPSSYHSGSKQDWGDDPQDYPFHGGESPSKEESSGTIAVPSGVPMTLYLPCKENYFAGFCKGAGKLQNGDKKAFRKATRPEGFYTDIPFWLCSSCSYEGPMIGGAAKSTRTFDHGVRIHEATGIRYRWVFLAKSHVTKKIFGCIFCCAERKTQCEKFKDLSLFMDHLLQKHRHAVPGMEALLYRTKCILGRVADDAEDFDINIPPET